MDILIHQARIVCPSSSYHGQVLDVSIQNGRIAQIAPSINPLNKDTRILQGNQLHISTGWLDLRVTSKEPGHESVEDFQSLTNAAAAGGFTQLAVLPNTSPVVQTKQSIALFNYFNTQSLVDLLPIAAVTKDTKGTDFTEMLDLNKAGAIAFSDGHIPLWNADIFLKTLQYLYPTGKLLMNQPTEASLSMFGQMHEGIISTLLGMKGIPNAAEELMLLRDLKLLEYANLTSDLPLLHFSTISTAEGVQLIREAKQKGLPISCDIAAHQLSFIDEDLMDFNTNLKVNPPFRSENDRLALLNGLLDGTIDAVVSDHHPQDEEAKKLEFDQAENGIIGLQTAFSALQTLDKIPLEKIIQLITDSPRRILRQPIPKIEVGELANLTLFEPESTYVFTEEQILSKSKNSPYLGQILKGKVLGIIHKNQTNIPA
ncbi:MAG: dihydroorotase [Spirosomataceae bacterium]